MKSEFYKFLLFTIFPLIILISCKENISPNDKFIGVYDYYLYGIPGTDADGNFLRGEGRLSVRKVNKQEVSFSVYEADNSEASWVFPHCEIIKIDTTGNKYQHYARVLNKDNNTEIAKIRNWYLPPTIPVPERVYIEMNFIVENNKHIIFYAMQRIR
jgi:hypothetical protein